MSIPRVGSRPWVLANMVVSQSLTFEAQPGRLAALMQQIGTDARRVGAHVTMRHVIGVEPSTRNVYDIVRVTKVSENDNP